MRVEIGLKEAGDSAPAPQGLLQNLGSYVKVPGKRNSMKSVSDYSFFVSPDFRPKSRWSV